MRGMVIAAAPARIFKAIEVFMSASCAEVTNLWAPKLRGRRSRPTLGLRPATQCVGAILGERPNGTVTQVAVRTGKCQVSGASADNRCFLRTKSQIEATVYRRPAVRIDAGRPAAAVQGMDTVQTTAGADGTGGIPAGAAPGAQLVRCATFERNAVPKDKIPGITILKST